MGPPAGRENHRGFLQSLDRSNLCSLAQTWATLKDWHDSREAILVPWRPGCHPCRDSLRLPVLRPRKSEPYRSLPPSSGDPEFQQ